jgi:hypothetical protein
MRLVIALVVLIAVGIIGYMFWGIASREPTPLPRVTFDQNAPDPAAALPEVIGAGQTQALPDIPLTPEQKKQAEEAIVKITEAVTGYRDLQKTLTRPASDAMATLNAGIVSGRLPAYFLSGSIPRQFETLKFDPQAIITTEEEGKNDIFCQGNQSILIGNDLANNIACENPAVAPANDKLIMGGPGDDTINDTAGNRIINPGSGDDVITVGKGRTIILLDEAWGNDKLTIDCADAKVTPDQIPLGFPVPWTASFTNFIVLSPQIAPASISWQGNVLNNSVTGSTLSVNENCFTLVTQ